MVSHLFVYIYMDIRTLRVNLSDSLVPGVPNDFRFLRRPSALISEDDNYSVHFHIANMSAKRLVRKSDELDNSRPLYIISRSGLYDP